MKLPRWRNESPVRLNFTNVSGMCAHMPGVKFAGVRAKENSTAPKWGIHINRMAKQKPSSAVSTGEVLEPGDAFKDLTDIEKVQALELRRLGVAVVAGYATTSQRYLELCQYIRKEKVSKKLATRVLLELRFSKSRASEICRVAALPAADFSPFEARKLSFAGALQVAKGTMDLANKELALEPDLALPTRDSTQLAADMEEGAPVQGEGRPSDGEVKKTSASIRAKGMAYKLLKFASDRQLLSKTWTAKDCPGYTLILEYTKPGGKAVQS